MLGHCQQHAAAGPRRTVHPAEHGLVVVDVLDHVEGADYVELVLEWNGAGIHLHELRSRHARRGIGQAFGLCFAGPQHGGRKGGRDALQHETGAATDFHELPELREITPQRPDDQPVACTKPEIARLQRGQSGKQSRIKALGLPRQLRGQRNESGTRYGTVTASTAIPAGARQRLATAGTNPQPWLPMTMPAIISASPISLGAVTGSWNTQALSTSTSTKARLMKG